MSTASHQQILRLPGYRRISRGSRVHLRASLRRPPRRRSPTTQKRKRPPPRRRAPRHDPPHEPGRQPRHRPRPAPANAPHGRPTAQKIMYCSDTGDGNWAVWLMNADGSNRRKLTHPKLIPCGNPRRLPRRLVTRGRADRLPILPCKTRDRGRRDLGLARIGSTCGGECKRGRGRSPDVLGHSLRSRSRRRRRRQLSSVRMR